MLVSSAGSLWLCRKPKLEVLRLHRFPPAVMRCVHHGNADGLLNLVWISRCRLRRLLILLFLRLLRIALLLKNLLRHPLSFLLDGGRKLRIISGQRLEKGIVKQLVVVLLLLGSWNLLLLPQFDHRAIQLANLSVSLAQLLFNRIHPGRAFEQVLDL